MRSRPLRWYHLIPLALILAAALLWADEIDGQSSDVHSWGYHAVAGAGGTLAVDLALDDPRMSALVSSAVVVGHEIGQARVRGSWTTDSTMDVVSGVIGSVVAARVLGWLNERRCDCPEPEREG